MSHIPSQRQPILAPAIETPEPAHEAALAALIAELGRQERLEQIWTTYPAANDRAHETARLIVSILGPRLNRACECYATPFERKCSLSVWIYDKRGNKDHAPLLTAEYILWPLLERDAPNGGGIPVAKPAQTQNRESKQAGIDAVKNRATKADPRKPK